MRRTVMSALAAVVALGLAALGAPVAQAAPPPTTSRRPSRGARAPTPPLAGKAECGFVTAPLDYAQPGGEKIKIAVSRVQAHGRRRQGAGPDAGQPGRAGRVGPRPRRCSAGPCPSTRATPTTGSASTPAASAPAQPALSCIPDYGGYNRPEYDPAKAPGVVATWQARAERYAAACATKGGALLGHLTTEDAAKDLDTIRKALGAKQINFYGFSYGTYLGQVYATLFPQNLRRAVFDGVVDHRGVWYQDNLDQDVAFQKTIEVYFDWVAKNDAVYHLGNTGDAVEKLYYAERDKLRAEPAGGKIGPSEWTDIFLQAGLLRLRLGEDRLDVREVGAQPRRRRAGGALRRHGLGERRQRLRDLPRRPVHRHARGRSRSPGCSPTTTRVARTAPFETWGNAWYNAPCSYWKAPAPHAGADLGRGAPPILLINETLDAATPYSGALEARRVFGRSALVEGVGRHDPRGLAVRGGVHRQHDRRLPGHRRAARRGWRATGRTSGAQPVPQPAPT